VRKIDNTPRTYKVVEYSIPRGRNSIILLLYFIQTFIPAKSVLIPADFRGLRGVSCHPRTTLSVVKSCLSSRDAASYWQKSRNFYTSPLFGASSSLNFVTRFSRNKTRIMERQTDRRTNSAHRSRVHIIARTLLSVDDNKCKILGVIKRN